MVNLNIEDMVLIFINIYRQPSFSKTAFLTELEWLIDTSFEWECNLVKFDWKPTRTQHKTETNLIASENVVELTTVKKEFKNIIRRPEVCSSEGVNDHSLAHVEILLDDLRKKTGSKKHCATTSSKKQSYEFMYTLASSSK